MSNVEDVERIRFKMERIRRYMDEDVNRLQADAAKLLDWKYYILRHPLASVAAVAAAGFLLVPKTRPVIEKKVYLDPDVSREVAQSTDKLQVEQSDSGAKQGLLVSLGVLALNTLVKAGLAYAGQQVRQTWLQDFQPVDKTPSGTKP